MSREFYDSAVFGELAKLKSMYQADPAILHSVDEYGFTALHGVASEEHIDIAEWLIKQGINPNVKNDDGITPLHLAAYPEMVELLCSLGANIDAQANNGYTPLMNNAVEPDTEEVMEALLELGAKINVKDKKGRTAFDLSNMRGEDEKVKLLKTYGAK